MSIRGYAEKLPKVLDSTSNDNNYIRRLLARALEPLTIEEEQKIFEEYHPLICFKEPTADQVKRIKELQEQVLFSNVRFVISRAKKYWSKEFKLIELIDMGIIGLIHAMRKHNPQKGSFLSYAGWWVKQKILRDLHNLDGAIRLPVYYRKHLKKIEKVIEEQAAEGNQIANNPARIQEILKLKDQEISLKKIKAVILYKYVRGNILRVFPENKEKNPRIFPEEKISFGKNEPEEACQRNQGRVFLQRIIKETLVEEKQIALNLFYGLENNKPHSLEEISLIVAAKVSTVGMRLSKARDKIKPFILELRDSRF